MDTMPSRQLKNVFVVEFQRGNSHFKVPLSSGWSPSLSLHLNLITVDMCVMGFLFVQWNDALSCLKPVQLVQSLRNHDSLKHMWPSGLNILLSCLKLTVQTNGSSVMFCLAYIKCLWAHFGWSSKMMQILSRSQRHSWYKSCHLLCKSNTWW